jgi:hypothetical protein
LHGELKYGGERNDLQGKSSGQINAKEGDFGLKYRSPVPITFLSQDNGGWQPERANRETGGCPYKNPPHDKEVVKKTPRKGRLKEQSI